MMTRVALIVAVVASALLLLLCAAHAQDVGLPALVQAATQQADAPKAEGAMNAD
jgi:hypothetical protein